MSGSTNNLIGELARLGVATVYEAGGRTGLIDLDLRQVMPGSRVAGPARMRGAAHELCH
jgi:4-hydroxy-4-methyl-2-oxoglutarate aldolase